MIKLGILDADILREDLQEQYVSYAHMMLELFHQIPKSELAHDIEFQFYNVMKGQYPKHFNENDAYLITGSKSSAYDDDQWILTLKEYIQCLFENNKKMLGICFGHQLIAHTLGGKTELAPQGWGVGVHTYATSKLAKDITPVLGDDFSLLVSHRDQVTQLPNGASLIASSEFCPNAAYVIPEKVLSFQGHPEFIPDYANALMQARKEIIEKETFETAQQNYQDRTQHLNVAKAMLGFIQG